MFLFVCLILLARIVVLVVMVLQFILVLFNGEDNLRLRTLGKITGKWIYQTICFLTFNSEQKPFPFDDWPEPDEQVADKAESSIEKPSSQSATEQSDDNQDKPQ